MLVLEWPGGLSRLADQLAIGDESWIRKPVNRIAMNSSAD